MPFHVDMEIILIALEIKKWEINQEKSGLQHIFEILWIENQVKKGK
jgi:hypothetical protein